MTKPSIAPKTEPAPATLTIVDLVVDVAEELAGEVK